MQFVLLLIIIAHGIEKGAGVNLIERVLRVAAKNGRNTAGNKGGCTKMEKGDREKRKDRNSSLVFSPPK